MQLAAALLFQDGWWDPYSGEDEKISVLRRFWDNKPISDRAKEILPLLALLLRKKSDGKEGIQNISGPREMKDTHPLWDLACPPGKEFQQLVAVLAQTDQSSISGPSLLSAMRTQGSKVAIWSSLSSGDLDSLLCFSTEPTSFLSTARMAVEQETIEVPPNALENCQSTQFIAIRWLYSPMSTRPSMMWSYWLLGLTPG